MAATVVERDEWGQAKIHNALIHSTHPFKDRDEIIALNGFAYAFAELIGGQAISIWILETLDRMDNAEDRNRFRGTILHNLENGSEIMGQVDDMAEERFFSRYLDGVLTNLYYAIDECGHTVNEMNGPSRWAWKYMNEVLDGCDMFDISGLYGPGMDDGKYRSGRNVVCTLEKYHGISARKGIADIIIDLCDATREGNKEHEWQEQQTQSRIGQIRVFISKESIEAARRDEMEADKKKAVTAPDGRG